MEKEQREEKEQKRNPINYSDGSDLVPLKPINVGEIKDFDTMLRGMEQISFGGRTVGEAASVLEAMFRDENCFRVLTLSGAMTPGQMGLVISNLIDLWFDVVVSTGAILAHGLVQGIGGTHFKAPPGFDDKDLYLKGANRIGDTIELEKNLDSAEKIVRKIFGCITSKRRTWSNWKICREIGKYLDKNTPEESKSILKSAYRKKVPIFIPAFIDSELALNLCVLRYQQAMNNKPLFKFNPFLDFEKYASLIEKKVREGKKLGIFIIGGGTPRNFAQQVGPYLDVRGARLGEEHGVLARFTYAVRIYTGSENDGSLSTCPFEEGVSWGKFVPREEGGRFAEVNADATIVLPMLVRGLMERLLLV